VRVALTRCSDALIRRITAVLPPNEITMGTLDPWDPDGRRRDNGRWDAILTTVSRGLDADHLRVLRRRFENVPILAVVEGGGDDSTGVVAALDAGADAVMEPPLDGSVLCARLRALGCRGAARDPFRYGDLRLDRLRQRIAAPGGRVALTPRECQILQSLLLDAEHVIPRRNLVRSVWWEEGAPPSANCLDVHVSRIRRKLDSIGALEYLHTIRGVGFLFGRPPFNEGAVGRVHRHSIPHVRP